MKLETIENNKAAAAKIEDPYKKFVAEQLLWIMENCKMKEPSRYRRKETSKVTIKGLEGITGRSYDTVRGWLHGRSLIQKEEQDKLIKYFDLPEAFFVKKMTSEELQRKRLEELSQAIKNNPESFWVTVTGSWLFSPNEYEFDIISKLFLFLESLDPAFERSIEHPENEKELVNSVILVQRFLEFTSTFWPFFKDHISGLQKELSKLDSYYYQRYGVPSNDIDEPGEGATSAAIVREKINQKSKIAKNFSFSIDCDLGQSGQPDLEIYTKKRYDPNAKLNELAEEYNLPWTSKHMSFDKDGDMLVDVYKGDKLIDSYTKVLDKKKSAPTETEAAEPEQKGK